MSETPVNDNRLTVLDHSRLRAKAAKPRHHTGPRGPLGCGFDPIHERIARVDIHPCIRIGDPVLS